MKKLRASKIRRHRKSSETPRRRPQWRGTEIVVTYKGDPDHDRDRAIRKALGKYETGSGFSFMTRERDHTATVPDDDFAHVIGNLRAIAGTTTKKLVRSWVRCY